MTKAQRETAINAWRLCREIPLVAYRSTPPNEANADTVARCLFMICAHESNGFKARRQYGFSADSIGGAFGLWQCERDGINRAVERMSQREIWNRCCAWLRKEGSEMPMDTKAVMMAVQKPNGDALACLIARVYHLGVTAAIPADLVKMADYCKKYHNTDKGKATPELYLAAYRFWLPIAEGGA